MCCSSFFKKLSRKCTRFKRILLWVGFFPLEWVNGCFCDVKHPQSLSRSKTWFRVNWTTQGPNRMNSAIYCINHYPLVQSMVINQLYNTIQPLNTAFIRKCQNLCERCVRCFDLSYLIFHRSQQMYVNTWASSCAWHFDPCTVLQANIKESNRFLRLSFPEGTLRNKNRCHAVCPQNTSYSHRENYDFRRITKAERQLFH